MYIASYQQFSQHPVISSGIGSDTGLYLDILRLIVFLHFFVLFCFAIYKAFCIFVRLLHCRIVFALYYMQFDKRKLTAGHFKLHRLLYFARAVAVCPFRKDLQLRSGLISVASSMLPPEIR